MDLTILIAHSYIARLKDEVNRLQEHVQENQQLNNTLQLELSVYDKMHDDKKVNGEISHDTQSAT